MMPNASAANTSSEDDLYPALDPERKSTRLLSLISKEDDGSIRCALTNHALEDAPPFVGLSYVWGAPGPAHCIIVNGQQLQVRENLWSALQYLLETVNSNVSSLYKQRNSKDKMPQSFWIDAICINQENDSERGEQVNLMKDIFSAASFVIAWIGEPESQEGLPALFDYLKDLKHTPRNNRSDFLRNSKRRFAFEDARWLVSRPYWSRIWIVQEFTLARELYILCGPHAIPWPSLQQFSPFGMSKTTNLGFKHLSKQESHHSISKHVDSCRELSKLRRSRLVDSKRPSFTDREPDSGARPTLTRLLAFCKDYQCTDPRDRVYGLLGLTELDDEDEDGLRADYSIDAFQLYHRVLSHLGKRGRPPSEMFRFRLAQGLQVADHESFSTSTFVYEAVASRSVKRLLRSGSSIWESQLLRDVENHLAINNPEVGRNRGTDSYENVMSYFNCFPREQDPDTWATFEEAMKAVYHLSGNQ